MYAKYILSLQLNCVRNFWELATPPVDPTAKIWPIRIISPQEKLASPNLCFQHTQKRGRLNLLFVACCTPMFFLQLKVDFCCKWKLRSAEKLLPSRTYNDNTIAYNTLNTIPFWTEVTKPWTESCAEKNCDDKVVFVKYSRDFKAFQRNHAHSVKYYFPGNVLHGWKFQYYSWKWKNTI